MCWLLERWRAAGKGTGRSENVAPCSMRALWAREPSVMKIAGTEPMRSVKMGPYRARRLWRTDSRFWIFKDRRSHNRFPIIGAAGGPGGSFRLVKEEKRKTKIAPHRETQRRKSRPISILLASVLSEYPPYK
ncbi:hypothetical protein IEQ34_000062 [Dendrobium chrysotoxum]|uniref:Uncharacterized protein n=1 Tax=Dendrobium chrysotoxum TaxID=161865 RepID=A0AAV7H974_DENCH|nr:hypothetical protein IEQ34_000062 [Dendrobium chrysotoxum]